MALPAEHVKHGAGKLYQESQPQPPEWFYRHYTKTEKGQKWVEPKPSAPVPKVVPSPMKVEWGAPTMPGAWQGARPTAPVVEPAPTRFMAIPHPGLDLLHH